MRYANRPIVAVPLLFPARVASGLCLFYAYALYVHCVTFMWLCVFSLQLGNAMTVAAHTVGLSGHNDPLLQPHSYLYNTYILDLEIISSIINPEEVMMIREP